MHPVDQPVNPIPAFLDMKTNSSQNLLKAKTYASKDQPVVPTTRRPFDELLTAMRKGADMMKHGRYGKPKMHYFRLGEGDNDLTWRSAKGVIRSVSLWRVTQVVPGQTTDSFKRHPNIRFVHMSFSLIYKDKADGVRTLDLTANDKNTYELWFCGLQALAEQLNPDFSGGSAMQRESSLHAGLRSISPMSGAVGMPMGGIESPGMVTKPPVLSGSKPLPAKISLNGIGGGTAQGRVAGAMGLPVVQEQPGDCYRWGTSPGQGGRGNAVKLYPHPIIGINHLDVLEVAVGLKHAALLTRNGEMYTWGEGKHGKLGCGHQQYTDSPEKLHTLWGQPVRHICASESVTTALTVEGEVLMAGEFFSVVQANTHCQSIPRPILGQLTDRVIVQVSCGAFHAAAAASNGALFTWGDGLCGKLGHGDTQSCSQPRQVEALRDQAVSRVACGAWHTAAIASPLPDGADSWEGLSFIEQIALQHKMAAMYELTQEFGGSLYTWGGVSCPVSQDSPAKMPGGQHKGFLGLGDTQGRLLPTRVEGSLAGEQARSVAVGLTFTVVATLDGKVYQMGTTKAAGNHVPWENCLSPCQVLGRLTGHYVDTVSAGRYHVAALAGPLNHSTGKAQEGSKNTMIFVWGKGEDGQLGLGNCKDSVMPQLVEELNGRRIVQVACGGDQTMVVSLHDPGVDDTEERRRGYKEKMKQWFNPQPQRLTLEIPNNNTDGLSSSSLSSRNTQLAQHFNTPDPGRNLKRSASGLTGMVSKSLGLPRRRDSLRVDLTQYSAASAGSNRDKNQSLDEGIPINLNSVRSQDSEAESQKIKSTVNTQTTAASRSAEDSQGADIDQDLPIDQGVSQEEYVKALEAKLKQYQEMLARAPGSSSPQTPATVASPVDPSHPPRPTIVDVGGPGLDLRATLSPQDNTGHQTRRPTLAERTSRANLPVNQPGLARESTQQDTSTEVQDLARQRAALLAQLDMLDRRQHALAAQSPAEAPPDMGGQLPRITTKHSDRPSTVTFNALLPEDPPRMAKRGSLRARGHRRSKSITSPFVKTPTGGENETATSPGGDGPHDTPPKDSKSERIEVDKGVFIVLDSKDGQPFIRRITFSKAVFNSESADAWLQKNKRDLYKRYNILGTLKSSKGKALETATSRGYALGPGSTTPPSGRVSPAPETPNSSQREMDVSPPASREDSASVSSRNEAPRPPDPQNIPQPSNRVLQTLMTSSIVGSPSQSAQGSGAPDSGPPGTYSRAWFLPQSLKGPNPSPAANLPEEAATSSVEASPSAISISPIKDESSAGGPGDGGLSSRIDSERGGQATLACHPVELSPSTTWRSAQSSPGVTIPTSPWETPAPKSFQSGVDSQEESGERTKGDASTSAPSDPGSTRLPVQYEGI